MLFLSNRIQKKPSTFLPILSLLLIVCFIGIRSFLLVHQFSHHLNYSSQNCEQSYKQNQEKIPDQKSINQVSGEVFAKNLIDKKSDQNSFDIEDDCLICHLAAFYQSNILLAAFLIFSAALFFISQIFGPESKIKISHLLFLHQNRAPPAFL